MDEFYDLESDPYEMNNLLDVPELTQVRSDLRWRLIDHLESYPERGDLFMQWSVQNLLLALKSGL